MAFEVTDYQRLIQALKERDKARHSPWLVPPRHRPTCPLTKEPCTSWTCLVDVCVDAFSERVFTHPCLRGDELFPGPPQNGAHRHCDSDPIECGVQALEAEYEERGHKLDELADRHAKYRNAAMKRVGVLEGQIAALRHALQRIKNEMVATPEDAVPYYRAVAAAALEEYDA